MNLLITGTALFEMLRPHLVQSGAGSVLVCTYRVPDEKTLGLADHGYHLMKSDGPERLVDIALRHKVTSFLSTSMPEDMNLRDARAAALLSRHGISCVTQPEEFILLCMDKQRCKRWLEETGFQVAPGFRVANADEAQAVAQELGYPVVCKPANRWAGQGVCVAASDAELLAYFEAPEYGDITIEQYLDGEEYSVETVMFPDWSIALAPIYKGRTSPGSHAMEHVRLAPYPCAGLQRMALDMARAMNSQGPAEFEFVVTASGPFLTEVNPRFSGVTRMGVVGSGFNTVQALANLVLSGRPVHSGCTPARLIVELPVMSGDNLPEDWVDRVGGCLGVTRVIVLAVGGTIGRVELTGSAPEILAGAAQAHQATNRSLGQLEQLSERLASAAEYLRRGELSLTEGIKLHCQEGELL